MAPGDWQLAISLLPPESWKEKTAPVFGFAVFKVLWLGHATVRNTIIIKMSEGSDLDLDVGQNFSPIFFWEKW